MEPEIHDKDGLLKGSRVLASRSLDLMLQASHVVMEVRKEKPRRWQAPALRQMPIPILATDQTRIEPSNANAHARALSEHAGAALRNRRIEERPKISSPTSSDYFDSSNESEEDEYVAIMKPKANAYAAGKRERKEVQTHQARKKRFQISSILSSEEYEVKVAQALGFLKAPIEVSNQRDEKDRDRRVRELLDRVTTSEIMDIPSVDKNWDAEGLLKDDHDVAFFV